MEVVEQEIVKILPTLLNVKQVKKFYKYLQATEYHWLLLKKEIFLVLDIDKDMDINQMIIFVNLQS